MKNHRLIIIVIGILIITATLIVLKFYKYPEDQSSQRSNSPNSQHDFVLTKSDNDTSIKNLRIAESSYVKSFGISRHSIFKNDEVIWNDDQEQICKAQESPDGSMVIFYKTSANKYEIYKLANKEFNMLDTRLPNSNSSTRVDSWYWVGNDWLIGETHEYFDPVPKGHGNEGWVKGSKLYAYDLKNKNYGELKIDDLPVSNPVEYKILTDEYDPSYSYKLPISRYYRIKGISDEGVIFLTSVDTSQPLGANSRDEGAFVIKVK